MPGHRGRPRAPTAPSGSSCRTAPGSASPTTSRLPSRSRTSNGVAIASTNATFAPLTASRWLSPASRKSSTRSSGIDRVSPRRKPASTARSVAGSPSAPRSTAAREVFASRSSGDRGAANAVSSDTCELRDRVAPAVAGVEAAQRLERSGDRHPVAGFEHPELGGDVSPADEQDGATPRVGAVDPADAREHLDDEARAGRVFDQRSLHLHARASRDRGRRSGEPRARAAPVGWPRRRAARTRRARARSRGGRASGAAPTSSATAATSATVAEPGTECLTGEDPDDDRGERTERTEARSHRDQVLDVGEAELADPADVLQLTDALEPAPLLALGDDRPGEARTDAGQLLELALASRC